MRSRGQPKGGRGFIGDGNRVCAPKCGSLTSGRSSIRPDHREEDGEE
jgi:hypothetical protein